MTRRAMLSLLVLTVCISSASAEIEPSAAGKQVEQLFKTADGKTELKYLIYLPAEYDQKPREKWPVVLFLHGAGERGDDVSKVARHGPPMLAAKGKRDIPAIVISPLCPKDQWWTQQTQALLELVVANVKQHRADPRRIYLTGLSMGGYGSWHLAHDHPELFAAVAPICGGFSGSPEQLARKLQHTPIWAFHGGADNVVAPEQSRRLVEALKKARSPIQYTEYEGVKHDSWTRTYNNDQFWEWLLNQKNPRTP